jgi:hypothetical protein
MEDRVADLRARWTAEATAAAVAFLESRPVNFDLPTMRMDGADYLDLRGLRIEQTQIDRAFLRNVNLRWAVFRDVGFKNARFVGCNLSQATFSACYLRRAKFEKCDLVNAHFDTCDFSQASLAESRIDFASFRDCLIGLENVRLHAEAAPLAKARVYRSLKLNALSTGDFAQAGDLTFLEKTEERRALRARAAWWPWLWSLAQALLWGYGERPWRLGAFAALAIVAFGTLMYWAGAYPGKGWPEHIYFGAMSYLTIGAGEPSGGVSRLLAVLAGATGIATAVMLVAAVTKKVMYR